MNCANWTRHPFRGWLCNHCGHHATRAVSVRVHELRAARGLGCAGMPA